MDLWNKFEELALLRNKASLVVQTLGQFKVWLNGQPLLEKDWGRAKSIQLFQFFISNRNQSGLHKEVIMDRIWQSDHDQDFKVALHGINKILEPNRKARTQPKYVVRQGLSYALNTDDVWIDVAVIEQFIAIGNQARFKDDELSQAALQEAIDLYKGPYLPDRIYEDWSSEEREHIQVLVLDAFMSLAAIKLSINPSETIRLTQQVLQIDHCWEEAYRLQMQAFIEKGNRPQAIKTYEKCVSILNEEYSISPLPETKALLQEIVAR